ncbi:MAG: hypothetical protein PHW74_09360 [Desulfobacca sp.]|nr:hypothetical protein [Desulfobacca sp.]
MSKANLSVKGGLAGALIGLAADVTITEITGHHITNGLLELVGAAVGLWRLDRRLGESLQDTIVRARLNDDEDYRQVAKRIDELTEDLPELRETILRMVEAGMSAQNA